MENIVETLLMQHIFQNHPYFIQAIKTPHTPFFWCQLKWNNSHLYILVFVTVLSEEQFVTAILLTVLYTSVFVKLCINHLNFQTI